MKKNLFEERQLKEERDDVISRYDQYTRDELIAELDLKINALPEELRASVRFEVDMDHSPYDPSEYPRLFMTWKRPETDREMNARIKRAKQLLLTQEERELQEFKRLQKKYGEKK